ncbi:MAG: ThuA domain-containing protein [Pirellulales bacterium]|nr:ThuA domain-containing protein [Pirellulales bacterium]
MWRPQLIALVTVLGLASYTRAEPIKAVLIDGQNNHDWRATSPLLKRWLEETGLFTVDVATSPAPGEDMSRFDVDFGRYAVVVSNYNGEAWPERMRQGLINYVRGGGGLVIVHAANNAFGDWPEWNELIGLGGWGGRDEKSGPYVYFQDDQVVRDPQPGGGGSHGAQHPFEVVVRDPQHPITAGMPRAWLHAQDELYDRLRGPAGNMTILATAYSNPAQGGSGRHEPMIWTVTQGRGRVFHTPMGHADYSLRCVGFITTYQRGTQWAATGQVTIPIPPDFPTAERASSRE